MINGSIDVPIEFDEDEDGRRVSSSMITISMTNNVTSPNSAEISTF